MTQGEPAILGARVDAAAAVAHAVPRPVRPRPAAPTVHVAGLVERALYRAVVGHVERAET